MGGVSRGRTPPPASASGSRSAARLLVAGRIVRPHGVRGQVIVEADSDMIERLRPGQSVLLGDPGRPARLISLAVHGGRYLIGLEGCTTRQAAEALRNEVLQCTVEDLGPLPEGVHYRWQIVGLRAVTDEQADLGVIADVFSTGANDVYEIVRPDGSRLLLPAISSVIRQIDLEHGIVQVHLLPGLTDVP